MHVVLLCVGKLKSPWVREACDEFAVRVGRTMKLEVVELPASKEKDQQRQREDESNRILDATHKIHGRRYVLDERGTAMNSPAFAKLLGAHADRGETVVFLLGGAYGFTDAVRSSGKSIRLSDMTLPHELCRVVFLEQLYRATEIGRGSGYHH